MALIRVLVVDDHQVVRQGLRRMLELDRELQVVGEAASGEEALALTASLEPEVVLMDARMPGMDGMEALRQLKRMRPNLKVIVLTVYGEHYLAEALASGASGYLLKDVSRGELIQALKDAWQGRPALASGLVSSLVNEFAALAKEKKARRGNLTPRQVEVLRLVASGTTNEDIANQLFVSLATVKRELNHIFSLLNAKDRTAAVAEAYRRQIL